MDHFYTLKIALSYLAFTLIFNHSLLGAEPIEYCGFAQDSIFIDSDHARYTIEVNGTVEKLVLSNLELGASYQLWVSSQTSGQDCIFGISQNYPKLSTAREDKQTIKLVAKHTSETIYIRNTNCSNSNSLFADISISKNKPEDINEMLSMMGIMTDPNYTAQQLIEDVFIGGGCFEVTNVQPIGNAQGIGFFSNGTSSVSIDEGVILASGAIGNSAGPNDVTNITTNFNDLSGDPDLNILASGTVYDDVGIEFDFTPVVNTIQFNFVFASDEYCDYVNTGFNDAFGFFISGPGFNGPYTNGGENIALVPVTGQDVTINTINIQTNSAYYVDNVPIGQPQNAGGCVAQDLNNPGYAEQDIEYDGFTTILTATANVQVCESYHIRLVVGDVADGIFDSAVFLEANSFNTGGDVSMDVDLPGLGSSGLAYEGCAGEGYIIFERPPDGDLSQDYTVFFNIAPGSTATNGVDFTNLPPSVTIPAGQSQVLLPLSIYEDFLTEGIETLILELDNPCTCDDASIEIQISDTPPMFVTTPELEFCDEQMVTLAADVSGGLPEFTYLWSNGGTGPSINVDAIVGTQTYTVTVTDDCGNQEESTATITVGEAAYAFIEGFVEVCDGNPIGFLTITFTGNGPWDLTYLIDGVPQQPILGITENPYFLQVSELGTYTIGSLNVDGCPGYGDGSGIVLPTIFNSFSVVAPVSCPGLFDGAIDFIMAGGMPEYSYEWSNGFYTEDIDNLGSGVYTVTVTDANGCTHTDSVELEEPEVMIANAVQVQGVDCLDTLSGSANLTVTGGNPGYTFEWDNGSILEDPIDLSAGPHTVTITDQEGCETDATVTITQDAVPPVAEAEVSGILTCDEVQVSINGSNSSGGDSLSYAWLDANDDLISNDTLIDVLDPGTYILIVTNMENGCSDEVTINVDQDIAPPTPQTTGGILNCNETEITLNAYGSSGAGALEYSWLDSNGTEVGTLDTLNVDEPGMYTLIITDDSNGCSADTTVEVTQNINLPEPQAEASGILTCEDLSISIDGSGSTGNGNIAYQWLDNNGDSLSVETQIDVSEPGTYTLVVFDIDNGCSAETTVQVDQNIDEPTPDAVANGVIDCIESTVFIDGSGSSSSGSISYQWLDNGTEIGITPGLDVDNAGTYTLIVTDDVSGCTAQTEVIVNEDIAAPTPEATTSGILTCDQITVTLDGSTSSGNGNITYEWFNASGDVVSNDPDFDVTNTGVYTLVITDDSNGCTAETTVTVDENIQDPVANAGDDGILNCNESSVNLDGSASSSGNNITYEWLDENSENVGNQISIDVAEAGTYTLIVSDTDNGCTASAQVTIAIDENSPIVNAVVQGIINCNDTNATLDGSASSGIGPIVFQWLDDTGAEISIDESTSVNTPGMYTLIITDTDNGCSSQEEVEVLENMQEPQPDIIDPDLLTCNVTSVELNASNSSGGGTISYQWQDSSGGDLGNTSMIDVADPGTYTLIITDGSNGCTSETSVIVDQNIENPIPDALVNGILTCEILDVTLDGSGSTGSGGLEYQWLDPNNNQISTEILNDINTPGTYTLIVTNTNNGCSAETTITVDQDINDPVAQAVVDDVLNCEIISVTLDGTSSTGNNTITYQWLDPNGDPIANVSTLDVPDAGIYTLIVTDQVNGCSNETTVNVDANYDTPQPNVVVDGLLTCENLSVLLDGNASSSTGGLSYQWLDVNNMEIGTAPTLDVSSIGTYTLVVTDLVSACTESITITVDEDITPPLANAGPENTLTCDIETVILDGGNSSTGSIFEYEWFNASGVSVGNEITVEVGEAGEFTLVVTNTDNGCTASSSALVIPDENLPTADAGVGSLLTCDIIEAILDGGNSSTGNNIIYEWLDANGNVIDNNIEITVSDPGVYTLIVTDQNNGCSATSLVEIDQNINAPQANPGNSPTLTCEIASVMLDGSGSVSSIGDLNYEWFNNIGTSIGTDSTVQVDIAGTYTLMVTSANGCTSSANVDVVPDENIPTAIATEIGILTCDVSEALIDAGSSTSISGNISFEWLDTNGDFLTNDPDFMVGVPGVYTLIVTDTENGCTTSASVEVPQDIEVPQVFAGQNDTLNCTITDLQLNGSATNGINFGYEWFDINNLPIAQSSTVTVNAAGVYTLVVTNLTNGCSASDQVETILDIAPPLAIAGPGNTLTCATESVILDASASDQGSTILYEWQNPNGITISDELQVEVDQPGTYTIIVTDTGNNCTAQDVVNVAQDINDPLAAIDGIGPIELNCDINEVVLNGENSSPFNDLAFDWSTINGNIITATDIYEIEVDEPGTYTLTVVNLTNGCTDTQTYIIGENITPPSAFINSPPLINCYSPEININATNTSGNGNFEFLWTAADGSGIVSGQNTLNLTVNESGTYILTIENLDNGCDQTTDINVMADLDAPDAVANVADELDCVTETVQLSGTGSSLGNIFNYEWQGTGIVNGTFSLQPTVNQSGTYTLFVTNIQNGCTETAIVNVFENENVPDGLELGIVPPPCPGDAASIQIVGVSGGEGPYLYSIDGGDNFYDLTLFFGLDPGGYDVVVQDAIGCEYGEFVNIPEADFIFLQTELDLEIELGDTVQLNASVNVPEWALSSIVWTPSSSLSCDDCLGPFAFPHETTTYTLTVMNENGCPATDDITLRVRKNRGIYIPNVFSPFSSSGYNDIFHIFSDGKSVKNINKFQIYDRWGECVFRDYDFLPDDPAHGWDGYLRGEPLNPAVFVYWAEVEFIDGEVIIFKGDVTLVK
jgi:large repetitive protein